MLSQATTMVKNLARESESWNGFRQNMKRMQRKATDIQTEALALVERQIESLAIGEGVFTIDLTKDTILDFSGLEESAKTFYAEIALRQIWKLLTTGNAAEDGQGVGARGSGSAEKDEVGRKITKEQFESTMEDLNRSTVRQQT